MRDFLDEKYSIKYLRRIGMGLSCVYVPAVVIVAHYFDENRAIATAIAVGGTGEYNFSFQLLKYFLPLFQAWEMPLLHN